MGEVYLAEDTKLSRKVALKVLPPELAESEERRARFEREAKAIAALDHPNIVQVFSVEEAGGVHFFTMQLVRGKTLTELISNKALPLKKFFAVAIPLADAVAAAHQEGITHRDLKPDNVMVSDDGRVTVLDFGLAKPAPGFAADGSELETQAKTKEGVIVGTVHYMSPEQAQGKTVDARSDIFSIGIVLYEMLTGRRPFEGDNPAAVLSSIIKDEPLSIVETRPEVSRELSKMVQRCLAKEPTRRLQSALDVRNELEDVKKDLASGELRGAAAGPREASVNKWLAAASVVLLLALTGVLVLVFEGRAPDEMVPRLMNPVQVSSAVGVEDYADVVLGWGAVGVRVRSERQLGHLGNAARRWRSREPDRGACRRGPASELVSRWTPNSFFTFPIVVGAWSRVSSGRSHGTKRESLVRRIGHGRLVPLLRVAGQPRRYLGDGCRPG